MGISSLNAAASSFRPGDISQMQTSQALKRLNTPAEFSLESSTEHRDESTKLLDELSGQNSAAPQGEDLRKAFQDFVGQTLFSQMISSMRSTQEGAAYFNGGRAEKIFQGQLDQILTEKLSEASASKISDPMYKLFQLRRQ
jgi:peptidoglycan hydrolase FlgJ